MAFYSWRGVCVAACAALIGSASYASAANLVTNGSFEDPDVTHVKGWDIYVSIPGWDLYYGPAIEIQRGTFGWTAADGLQWVELDSDLDGPNGSLLPAEAASSGIYQDIATIADAVYELRFAFSPRPDTADNKIEVRWGGQIIDTLVADGTGLLDTQWGYHAYTLTARSDTTRLAFGDLSLSDTFGTFLDDVSVELIAIPEPATIALLGLAALPMGLRRRRHVH